MNQKELAKQIGLRFRSFRVMQGLRQKKVAPILGVSHNNISRLERGAVYRFSAAFLGSCLAEFGLSIDCLVTGQGPMILPDEDLKVSLPTLRLRKTKEKRLVPVSSPLDKRDLQLKLDELAASLTRATLLVQELLAHAKDQGARVKGK